jgi:hypothetical protein
MVVSVQVVTFYVVRKCSLVRGHQRFKGARIFRDELRMQLGYIFRFQDDHSNPCEWERSQISVTRNCPFWGPKWCHNPKHHNLKTASHYNEYKLSACVGCLIYIASGIS